MAELSQVMKAVAPRANPAFLKASAGLGSIMAEFGITSVKAQAQVIAQTAHECAGYTVFQEGLSYSAQRLCQVWPSRFPTLGSAEPFARNPRALANKVYNGRMGNRPGSDDGYDFRGSGPLQHTGRDEFGRVQRRTHLPVLSKPDWLRDPTHADAMWRAACSYFVDRGALAPANVGNTDLVTRKVNGGTIGLADRKLLVQRAEAALAGMPLPLGLTTLEQADDSKRKAKTASTAAPVGGAGGGGGSKQAGAEWGTAIAVGLTAFVLIGALAVIRWRRWAAKQGEVEAMRLEAIDARASLPPLAA